MLRNFLSQNPVDKSNVRSERHQLVKKKETDARGKVTVSISVVENQPEPVSLRSPQVEPVQRVLATGLYLQLTTLT